MKLNKAIVLAKKAASNSNMKFKLGALLFDDNTYVQGYNTKLYNKNKLSIHAEEMAIIKASRKNIEFKNATLVVVRINKNGKLMKNFSYNDCQNLINKMMIKIIYYIR